MESPDFFFFTLATKPILFNARLTVQELPSLPIFMCFWWHYDIRNTQYAGHHHQKAAFVDPPLLLLQAALRRFFMLFTMGLWIICSVK